MFTIAENLTDIRIRERNIVKVFSSMNIHQVATPELIPEIARTYVFFFREATGRMSVYIGIHFLQTDRTLYYTHSANPFSEDDLQTIEDDARTFAEDLGATLGEMDFSRLSAGEQELWIREQAIFGKKEQPAPASETKETPAAKKTENREAPPAVQPLKTPVAQPPRRPEPAAAPVQSSSRPAQPAGTGTVRPDTLKTPVSHGTRTEPAQPAIVKKPEVISKKTDVKVIAKPASQTTAKEALSSNSVVGREKEALAHLLASF